MSDAEVLTIIREFLFSAALIAAPLLATALIVGVVVGLVQALTSIQEMTLTFVPKIGAMLIVFFLSSSYMARVCVALFNEQVLPVIAQ